MWYGVSVRVENLSLYHLPCATQLSLTCRIASGSPSPALPTTVLKKHVAAGTESVVAATLAVWLETTRYQWVRGSRPMLVLLIKDIWHNDPLPCTLWEYSCSNPSYQVVVHLVKLKCNALNRKWLQTIKFCVLFDVICLHNKRGICVRFSLHYTSLTKNGKKSKVQFQTASTIFEFWIFNFGRGNLLKI